LSGLLDLVSSATAPSRPSAQTQFVLDAMGEATTRTEEALAAIRASMEAMQSRMGSLDERLEKWEAEYQQVASQLDLNSRAVGDHSRILDTIERRQESLFQQVAATAEAVNRIGGSKAASVFEQEDREVDYEQRPGKGILSPTAAGGWKGAPGVLGAASGSAPYHDRHIRVLERCWGVMEEGGVVVHRMICLEVRLAVERQISRPNFPGLMDPFLAFGVTNAWTISRPSTLLHQCG
jgi:hypothetical protein